MKAVIGIGTNIGDRYTNIQMAIQAFNLVPGVKVIRTSAIYETEPWGYTEQNNFYNNVIEVETEKSPEALLGICLGIESGMGESESLNMAPELLIWIYLYMKARLVKLQN